MTTHFLFKNGVWDGSGQITVPLSDDPFPLKVQWTISSIDGGKFRAIQRVEVENHDPMINTFTITNPSEGEFQIFLENQTIGMFSGAGVSDEKKVAWEFSHKGALEGFEVYEREKKDHYTFRAEYLGGDGFATIVSGHIKKARKEME